AAGVGRRGAGALGYVAGVHDHGRDAGGAGQVLLGPTHGPAELVDISLGDQRGLGAALDLDDQVVALGVRPQVVRADTDLLLRTLAGEAEVVGQVRPRLLRLLGLVGVPREVGDQSLNPDPQVGAVGVSAR